MLVRGKKNRDFVILTGNTEAISYLHSRKIRNEGDGAKLISANDSQNFTYRGRFVCKEEAFAVGNETSQKIHNALKWIIRKQGTFFDTLVIVTWESNRSSMPRWNADTEDIASEYDEEQDDWDDEENDESAVSDGNAITAEKFYKAIRGYGQKIENTSSMILLSFDAATREDCRWWRRQLWILQNIWRILKSGMKAVAGSTRNGKTKKEYSFTV